MIWTELTSAIARYKSFIIASHMNLDGDCVGSELAMYWYLRSLGKEAVIFNNEPTPDKFLFLKNADDIPLEKPDRQFDVLIVLDCSNLTRLSWDGANQPVSAVINIDHHRDNTYFGKVNVVEVDAPAAGLIMYDFFRDEHIDYPDYVAEALYTAILTDTGGFRFSNTNDSVFRACADLHARGVNSSLMYDRIYASFSPAGMLLQSRIWSTLTFYRNGTISSMEMEYSLADELGAKPGDAEGMADITVMATSVEVGMMIKYSPQQTHFSLRSRGKVDVGRIAKMVEGGGGHSCAAGCTMNLPFSEAKQKMLDIISKELD
jgi:phosphoesterase RecJ-like protein